MIQALSHSIGDFINQISQIGRNIFENLNVSQYSAWQVALDIFFVAIVFYWLIQLIRGTRATNIVFGFLVLAFVFAVSRWMQLLALGWLLDRFLTVILVAIPIIFQQELRRGLEKLGRTKFFLAKEAKEVDFLRSAVTGSLFDLASRKHGALIVFRGDVSLKEYVDTGVFLGARVSQELLLSIFNKESPLHDGAVIFDQNRLAAAGCVLPHSFKEYGHRFGTRHKAALSLTETTDASVFVVSEQRGSVSFVREGDIEEDLTPERASAILTEILTPQIRPKPNA